MSYEFYKIIHFASIFVFLSALAVSLYGNETKKHLKILMGVSSLFLLVSGMGLLARIGAQADGGFPAWASFKIAIWLVLAIGGAIAVRRLKNHRITVFYIFTGLAIINALLAMYKPF